MKTVFNISILFLIIIVSCKRETTIEVVQIPDERDDVIGIYNGINIRRIGTSGSTYNLDTSNVQMTLSKSSSDSIIVVT